MRDLRTFAGAVALVLVGLLVLCSPARAQPKPSEVFTREYQAGVDLFRLGKYDEARAHLVAARDLEPGLPGPHRFLAAVAAAENKWDECIVAARTAIEANPLSNEIVATRKLHDDCRAALGRTPFAGEYADGGAIAVTANVAGASVSVAGLKYGGTPMAPRAFAVGPVEVLVQKAGYKDARVSAKVLPFVVTDVEVTLEADPDAKGGGVGELPPPVADVGWLRLSTTANVAVSIDGTQMTLDDRGRYPLAPGEHELDLTAPDHYPARRTVRISRGQETTLRLELASRVAIDRRRSRGRIAIATAVGFGAAGAVAGFLANRAEDEARDLWTIETNRPTSVPISESAAIEPVATRADIDAKLDRAKTLGLVSNVGYGVAAVSLGIGVYLLARTPDEPPPTTTVAPMVPTGGGQGGAWGVTVRGSL